MKKLFAVLLCAGLLCGCSDSVENSSASESSEEMTSAAVTTILPAETTAPPVTTTEVFIVEETTEYHENDAPWTYHPVPEGADPDEVMSHYTFEVDEDGVWVYYDGQRVELLDADTSSLLEYDAPESFLYTDDFNFDMYADLFIPEMLGRPNLPGRYYRFDTNSGIFVIWQELDEQEVYLSPNAMDGTLTRYVTSSSYQNESTVFEWQGEKLVTVGRVEQYQGSDGNIYIDYFTVENGEETLYYREQYVDGSFVEVDIE